MLHIRSPMQAQLVQCLITVGDTVQAGDVLLVIEAMKMEHELRAKVDGVVKEIYYSTGDAVNDNDLLLVLVQVEQKTRPIALENTPPPASDMPISATNNRADLQTVLNRHQSTLDAARGDAIAKRHALGMRTARENISDLCEEGSFLEYGALAIAAQRSRRSHDDLIANTPADGMVTGIGSINAASFSAQRAKAVVMAYDATVLAGTQGMRNHQKTDRLLGIALQNELPVVLFAEGLSLIHI
jgi:pyruvate/2-oxoglutarate dehydrogenase complex dihydrolipoamide acyltransferase (E2) component